MARTTKKELESLVKRLANAVGMKYSAKMAKGRRVKYRWSNDFLALDKAYGGYRLVLVRRDTSEMNLSPRMNAADTARWIRAMLTGISLKAKKSNVNAWY